MIGADRLLIPLGGADRQPGCGTKALNLARLERMGYRVPPGVVVTDQAFQQHLDDAGLGESARALLADLTRLDARELRSRSAAMRASILGTPLRAELGRRLEEARAANGHGNLLAVRSSAATEDGAVGSFAGLLDSVLGVSSLEQLEAALRTVWASFWSERRLAYAQRNGGGGALAMGVVIQQQVEARYSGVLFTRDPCAADGHNHAVIEYTSGLGDRLASGEITPNRARVSYAGLAVIPEGSGDPGAGQAMPDLILAELARIGLDLERRFGTPQDIEWSVTAGDAIVLLQSRPITTAGPAPYREVWTNANIAENFPDVVSPFLFSVVSAGYTAYFRNLGLGFGISRRRLDAMGDALENIVGLQGGRLYYNLTNIHSAIHLLPGGSFLAGWFNQFTGAQEFPAVRIPAAGILARTAEMLRVGACTLWQYLWVRRGIARFEDAVDRYAEATGPTRLAGRSLPDLALDLRAFLDIRLRRWNNAALADTAAMACYGLLQHTLAADAAGDTSLEGNLLSGLPDLASARPIAELWHLSREVRADPPLHELVVNTPAPELLVRLAQARWSGFGARFQHYIDTWGFRYSRELMLTCPTPREDPLPVLRLLQSYSSETGPGPAEISAVQADGREKATATMAARLTPGRWWRVLPWSRAGRFRLLLGATHGAIRLRERARMKQALLYTCLRHVLLCIGNQLRLRGLVEDREDVFFLRVDEVLAMAGTAGAAPVTMEKVRERRREHARCAGLQPPDSMELERGRQWLPGEALAPAGPAADGETLRGSSACGGRAEGIAVVVLDVREADQVRAGDVLVTRQTDPGWATVFFLVKGLVIERGGMLSHGAIIAREYGIPAVVGVPLATQRIRSGARVRVNGDQGVVEIWHG